MVPRSARVIAERAASPSLSRCSRRALGRGLAAGDRRRFRRDALARQLRAAHARRASLVGKNPSVNKAALRCDYKAMDARRGPTSRLFAWTRPATPQTRFVVATLRAGVKSGAGGCCKPLVVPSTTARLAPTPAPDLAPAQGRLIHG